MSRRDSSETIASLDGLRALSVLAVLAYHAREAWLPGGYLGVEVFFVLSGALITRLLLQERERTGRIDLKAFWQRRLRRLLPAQAALLLGLLALGALALGARASQFRGDLLPSLLYLENWHQIRGGEFYFADQGLPLLRHLWSLAVEGQFYLLWPVVLTGMWALLRRRGSMAFTALLALGSLLLMARLAGPAGGDAESLARLNRAYLGTDTRLSGLLLGGLLAMALHGRMPRATRSLQAASWLGLAVLLILFRVLPLAHPLLPRGGLLLVDAATLLILVSSFQGGGSLDRLLALKPLAWIGQRSYGLYLWHWPIFKLVSPHREGLAWMALRWALAFLVTELSFRFVEAPFRKGLRRALATAWSRSRLLTLAATSALALLLFGGGAALASRPVYVDEVRESLRAAESAVDHAVAPAAPPPPSAPPAPRGPAPAMPALPDPAALEVLEGVEITAIGDSVMKGAAPALKATGEAHLGEGLLRVDAEESRAFSAALQVARAFRKQERLGEVVVVHLGTNNSSLPEAQFRQLMTELSDRRLVVFVTARSDKTELCAEVNGTLARLAEGWPNVRVFDWNALAESHPDLFYSDRTHLRPVGARFYALSLLHRIAEVLPPEPPAMPEAP